MSSLGGHTPVDRRRLMEALFFGRPDAEGEDDLDQKFISTEAFRAFLKSDCLLLTGPKGSGKSALFDMVTSHLHRAKALASKDLPDSLMVAGLSGAYSFEPGTRKHFDEALATQHSLKEFWTSYFAAACMPVIGGDVSAHLKERSLSGHLRNLLRESGAIPDNRLFPVARRLLAHVGLGNLTVKKITVGPAGLEFASSPAIEAQHVLDEIEKFLRENGLSIWLPVDKLDEIATGRNRSSALADLCQQAKFISEKYPHIRPTLILRSDIWSQLDFASKDHFEQREVRLDWHPSQLLRLIVKRMTLREGFMDFFTQAEPSLQDRPFERWSADQMSRVFAHVFAAKVSQMKVVDWMMSRCQHANGNRFPRDLINLGNFAREAQGSRPEIEALIGEEAISRGFEALSKERYEKYLQAEFPELRPHLLKFNGQTSPQFTRQQLDELFSDLDPAGELAITALNDAGVLRPVGASVVGAAGSFEVPFLFRIGLGMKVKGPR